MSKKTKRAINHVMLKFIEGKGASYFTSLGAKGGEILEMCPEVCREPYVDENGCLQVCVINSEEVQESTGVEVMTMNIPVSNLAYWIYPYVE